MNEKKGEVSDLTMTLEDIKMYDRQRKQDELNRMEDKHKSAQTNIQEEEGRKGEVQKTIEEIKDKVNNQKVNYTKVITYHLESN